jgi:hypothetical protein
MPSRRIQLRAVFVDSSEDMAHFYSNGRTATDGFLMYSGVSERDVAVFLFRVGIALVFEGA